MDNKECKMKKISIVIPALNERDGIEKAIHAIPKEKLEAMGYEVEILVADNGSDDGSAELARKAGAKVVVEPRRGYGRAYKTGFAHATGEVIATADADASYPMKYIAELVTILEEDNLGFLTTNRFPLMDKGALSLQHKIGNTILSLAVRLLFQVNMRDPESGMWVFRKDILNKLRLGSDAWPFSHELKLEACYFNKCRWKEVPIKYTARVGKTKLVGSWKIGFADLFHIMKKRIIR
jgi:glycosyltransferase involved in cell wall biosynthesis